MEQNRLVLRRYFEDMWNLGNPALIDYLFAGDWIGHAPPGEIHDREDMKEFVSSFLVAFPDLHYTIEDEIAEGDRVVSRWVARGTHLGEFQEHPPTGRTVRLTGITIMRLANGRAVEGWIYRDTLGLLQQVRAVPPPVESRSPKDCTP